MPMIPRNPLYFNYPSVATQAGISESDLSAIETRVRQDFPNDQMMFELRMLRTCRAIQSGTATVTDALSRDDRSSAA
ncbi:MAG: hypothetical protein JNM86_03205 [Phycisphaerae bacterium]|nr:hypothetical protein [Phycisphaerae bacterium]